MLGVGAAPRYFVTNCTYLPTNKRSNHVSNQPANQPTNQTANLPDNQLTKQPTYRLVSWLFG